MKGRERVGKDKEISKKPKLTEEQKIEKAQEYREQYYSKNKDRILELNRNIDRKEYHKLWYHKNIDRLRSDARMKFWRQKQKELVIKNLNRYEANFFSGVENDRRIKNSC